jgi:hypothetical protein
MSVADRTPDGANANRLLESRAGDEIDSLKREFVVQLRVQEGPFWEGIHAIRQRRGITADVKHPSNFREYFLHPEEEPEWPGEPGDPGYSEEKEETHFTFSQDWVADLDSVICATVPTRYCDPSDPKKDPMPWRRFVAACVLHDPPDLCLNAFAEYGGPHPRIAPVLSGEDGESPENSPMMVEPPIVQMRDAVEASRSEYGYWMAILFKVWELYLKPQGFEFLRILEEIDEKHPEIKKTYQEETRRNGFRHYIKVDEHTTEQDVLRAFRMLAANNKTRPAQGHPGRDPLVCVQCAILYDEHNERDPEDRRRWKWTYEKLAEKFELTGKDGRLSARSAEAYVKEGRKRLHSKPQPKE